MTEEGIKTKGHTATMFKAGQSMGIRLLLELGSIELVGLKVAFMGLGPAQADQYCFGAKQELLDLQDVCYAWKRAGGA